MFMELESQRRPFSQTLICRCPESLALAVERAATSEMITKAAYARRAVMAALQRDGFLGGSPQGPQGQR
jgi:hypothetical protein